MDRPRTKAPITNAFSGSVRSSFVPLGNSFETNGSAASLTCGIPTCSSPSPGLHPARAKAVAQPPLILGPALIARPAEPRVELILNSPLDDQSGAELGEP